jgi:hypothetical protein
MVETRRIKEAVETARCEHFELMILINISFFFS